MKILVCVDGSEHSSKAMQKALVLAENSRVEEITLLHVYAGFIKGATFDDALDLEQGRKLELQMEKRGAAILEQAARAFAGHDFKVDTILKQGHDSHTIVQVAAEGNFDLIVIGSRGIGGVKKLFLGSTSNAVVQEARTNVLVVK